MADHRTASERPIDWEDARRHLRAAIRLTLGRVAPEDLEDLVGEALIQVLRAVRTQEVHSLSGLIAVIGRTTAIDEIRRRQRETGRRLDWEQHLERIVQLPTSSPDADDRVQMLWFLMLEYFRTRRAPCGSFALRYAELGDWKAVAEALGMSHDAVRQQWSRCARAFRSELQRNPGAFADWFEADG
jgi:DNA-directed RNA polymerase specialized sigma24 family protein